MPRRKKDEFDKIAPGFLKALKAKNENIRRGIVDTFDLRCLLSSAEFAKRRAPSVPQSRWVACIEKMMQQAEKQELKTGVFSEMLRTRDEEPAFEIPPFDLDDLKLDDGT